MLHSIRLLPFLAFAIVSLAAEPGALVKFLTGGRTLTAGDAAQLESTLESNPDNAEARAQLLGYYFHIETSGTQAQGAAAHASRLRHVLWLVSNHPESELAALPETRIFDSGPEYRQQKDLWLQQTQRFSGDARVLENAAQFLAFRDIETALPLMKQAAALQPQDRAIAGQLGMMLATTAMNSRGTKAGLADQAREDLRNCAIAAVCGSAGMAMGSIAQGRRGMPNFRQEDLDFAARLITTAQNLEPTNTRWSQQVYRLIEPNGATRSVAGGVLGAPPNASALSAPGAIRVGGNVQASNIVNQVQPVYPPLAKQARIQGTARFEAVIGKDGTIENLQLVSGHPLLVQAAQEAVKQWVYKPTLLNGQPVQVITTIDVNFTLNETAPPPPAAVDK